ncbi:MAG TPA: hypothetical protein VHZ02_10780, partial [Acidimicrobiales bacterium]|nr:hypothetical protein [Acidimicrobiales bacterium]
MTTAIGPLPAEEAAWAQADAPPTLTLIDLFNDTPTLTSHLCVQVAAGNWLDAFLLAVGVHQIAEDHWQRGRLGLRRAGGHLTQMDGRAARLAGGVAEGADRLDTWARANMPAVSRRGADLGPLAALIRDLCRSAMQVGGEPDRTALYRRAGAVSHAINTEPRREDDIVRLPSCFRSFDQRLEDVVRLARSFAERWPDRRQPLTVVGVRTSGSYLGPATAVALEGLGYSNITTATVRPGWPTPPVVRAALGDRAAAGSRFLIVDDPPMTGRSLADAVGQVRRAGTVGADRIAVLIALGPSGEADADRDLLGGAPVISLPWDRWAVHDQLTAGHVGQALTGLLPGGSWVRRTDAITSPTRPRRGHVRSVFRVELVDGATGAAVAETVAVEGVGLGYLGRHAVAVARAAPELVPPVFGFADGMLYRHWLPGGRERGDGSATAGTGGTNGSCAHGAGANGSGAGGTGGDNQAWADRARFLGSVAGSIAGSIAMRRHVLAVPVDRSLVLRGRQPAWEVASRLISRSLGPLAL